MSERLDMKKALITGINGMDGSHLADLLLKKRYKVYGMEHRSSVEDRTNTKHLEGKITFLTGDLSDQDSLLRCIKESEPDEIYNFGAIVGESWSAPEATGDVNALGVLRILEAIREFNPEARFCQASTSEMFGRMVEDPANEDTSFYPQSPYGVAKLYGHWITQNYRESYGMFACSGILFNHESERRGNEIVTRKISEGVAQVYLGLKTHLTLGNLEAERDWGYAPDFVEAMWLMLQQDAPGDYVIATGEKHSVKDFLNIAFQHIGIKNWAAYVKQDERYMRRAEVDVLRGDSTRARIELNWKPSIDFKSLVIKMVENDIKILREEK